MTRVPLAVLLETATGVPYVYSAVGYGTEQCMKYWSQPSNAYCWHSSDLWTNIIFHT